MMLRNAFASTRAAGASLRRAVAVPARAMSTEGGDYDLVVIGGGPGGYVAVSIAAAACLLTVLLLCA